MNTPFLRSIKLAGTPSYSNFTYIHEFKPNEQEVLLTRGQLFVLVAGSSQPLEHDNLWNANAKLANPGKVKSELEKLQDVYFGDLPSVAFESLKNSVKQTRDSLSQIPDIQIGALSQVGDIVYMVLHGQLQIALLRRSELIKIVDGVADKLISASGFVSAGDTLILGTKQFFSGTPDGVLKAALSQTNLDAVSDFLVPQITNARDNGAMGCLILRFDKESPQLQTKPQPRNVVAISSPLLGYLRASLLSLTDTLLNALPKRQLQVNYPQFEPTHRKKRNAAVVGIALMLILALSIGIGAKRRESVMSQNLYSTKLADIKRGVEEAATLSDLNTDRARALLLNAYAQAQELDADPLKDDELEKLKINIESSLGTIAGLYKQEGQLFLDLSLVSSGFKGQAINASEGTLVVLDKNGKKLVSIEIDSKRTQVLAGPTDIEDASDAAIYVNRSFLLTPEGVEEINAGSRLIIQKDWSDESRVAVYAGNVYILDMKDSKIYRFGAAGRGFGSKSEWLSSDVSVDLVGTRSWVIDGSMWILTSDEEVVKLAGGQKDFFALTRVGEMNLTDMYTNETAQYLYFLDAPNGKIWVYDKKGKFKAEYQVPQASEATKLVVSEEQKKIILLAESKLYVFEIKHL